jgi:methylmalonyl-CoA mutase
VEEAVLEEFDRLTERGGVLGAMELMYQRAKIQEESMHYEHKKFSGELPIIGVNTFLSPNPPEGVVEIELARATDAEKLEQIEGLEAFKRARADRSGPALAELKRVAIAGENVFETLLETVKHCSLGQVTEALFSVGGQYRRGM